MFNEFLKNVFYALVAECIVAIIAWRTENKFYRVVILVIGTLIVGIAAFAQNIFPSIPPAFPPSAPPSVPPSATPNFTSTSSPEFYDTFSNKIYENSYDNNLWGINGGNSAKVTQHDGVLVLSDSAPGVGNGFTLFLTQWHSTTFAMFRASVKIQHTAGSSNISLNANSPSLPDRWSEIALDDTLSGAYYHVKNGNQQITAGPAEYDTWTNLEIRYIPNENSIEFYLGNNLLATQKVSSDLSILTPSIQLWHTDNNEAASSVKDVQISTQYLQP